MNPSLQEIIACIGHPVAGNPTQFVMERAFHAARVDSRCLTLDVDPAKLEAAIRGMDSMGFCGAVIASPHEIGCRQYLNTESPACTKLGEVDLIHREEQGFVGANTMYRAINEVLARHHPLLDRRAVIFGDGSTARAAALVLSQSGVSHLTVVSNGEGNVDRLARLVRENSECELDMQMWVDNYRIPMNTDFVIQTVADSGTLPIDWATVTSAMVLLDTTYEYGSPRTEFIRIGTNQGAKCISGIDLFVERSSVAFQLWTGRVPDAAVMREAIEEFMLV